MLQKDLCVFKKARYVCPKALYVFKKLQHLFKKARYVFHVGTDGLSPSLSRLFFLFRSSLHFNENIQILNLLRMTGYPLILPSAILAKSLHNLPSAISLCTPTHLFSLPFSVWGHWADTWVRPYRKALSKKVKKNSVFLRMKGG